MSNVCRMARRDLERVTRAAGKLEDARQELRQAMIAAKEARETYRDIAEAAGMSHQRVWQIINEPPKRK